MFFPEMCVWVGKAPINRLFPVTFLILKFDIPFRLRDLFDSYYISFLTKDLKELLSLESQKEELAFSTQLARILHILHCPIHSHLGITYMMDDGNRLVRASSFTD